MLVSSQSRRRQRSLAYQSNQVWKPHLSGLKRTSDQGPKWSEFGVHWFLSAVWWFGCWYRRWLHFGTQGYRDPEYSGDSGVWISPQRDLGAGGRSSWTTFKLSSINFCVPRKALLYWSVLAFIICWLPWNGLSYRREVFPEDSRRYSQSF